MDFSEDPPPIIIGRDGAAMLGLSLAITAATAGLSFLIVLGHVWRTARRVPATVAKTPRRALILGQKLDSGGRPNQLFQARLSRARMLATDWPDLQLVILGGRTAERGPSEAEAGKIHLMEQGVAPSRILLEAASRHTMENLANFRVRLDANRNEKPVLVTSRFHLARSIMIADGLGIAHIPCAAEDEWAPDLGLLKPLLMEAFLIHWYVTGRQFARWTGNRRMAARLSQPPAAAPQPGRPSARPARSDPRDGGDSRSGGTG